MLYYQYEPTTYGLTMAVNIWTNHLFHVLARTILSSVEWGSATTVSVPHTGFGTAIQGAHVTPLRPHSID